MLCVIWAKLHHCNAIINCWLFCSPTEPISGQICDKMAMFYCLLFSKRSIGQVLPNTDTSIGCCLLAASAVVREVTALLQTWVTLTSWRLQWCVQLSSDSSWDTPTVRLNPGWGSRCALGKCDELTYPTLLYLVIWSTVRMLKYLERRKSY